MDIRTYLERIGYDKSVRPDLESLFGLHCTHLLTVPFENLDIHIRVPIQLSKGALWDKIVVHKRGGFCYELNGMFAWLLKQKHAYRIEPVADGYDLLRRDFDGKWRLQYFFGFHWTAKT